ncbi:hypothetical protein SAY86_020286 [Trapa natans]|uniref:Pentatricopeptide repeat-containing protein n=1 Tax=Trapa natans TaxID=22666 RepID=A0AAN7LMM8_TRANT|nr:hypothetical protein SAY86_020286 [Trapa natans]
MRQIHKGGAYVHNGLHEEVLQQFIRMIRDDVCPDQATFASVLKACATLTSPSLGNQVHSCLVKFDFMSNVFAGSALLDVYAKCGLMKEAIRTFEQMPTRNVISWNTMLTAYAHGDGKTTISVFEEMVKSGFAPNSVSFLNVLASCSHSGLVEEGLQYFDLMIRDYKHVVKREHYACVLDVLYRARRFAEAGEMMSRMPYTLDEIMWVSILNSCPHVNLANIYAALDRWDDVAWVKAALREWGIKKALRYVKVLHTWCFMGRHPTLQGVLVAREVP